MSSRVQLSEITPTDYIFLVVGPTGAGRTTLVNKLVGADILKASTELHPHTTEIAVIRAVQPDGTNCVFLDTPGFDYNQPLTPESSVFGELSKALAQLGDRKIRGILYLHPLFDRRFASQMTADFKNLSEMCGEQTFANWLFVMTINQDIPPPSRSAKSVANKEAQWCHLWRAQLNSGAKLVTFDLSAEAVDATWTVMRALPEPKTLVVVAEMVSGTTFEETRVGQTVVQGLAQQRVLLKFLDRCAGLFRPKRSSFTSI